MTSYIRSTAEFSIAAGKIDEFKKLAAEIIQKVEAGEPNTLSYEWFLSDDESKCYVLEIYKDSQAVMAHLGNVGEMVRPLLELAPLTRLRVYGNPSAEARQALEPLKPNYSEHLNGVTR